ncbi:MAG: TetR/AcrR family transcriptional regulator [Treponema sp.]|jgi:AcrR family transcriptional regulator|nr:TetR/AcrR family transcriptional regulator [Treponema sp.]
MSIVVEHEKRRWEILEKALDVFIEEGFEDATFQKIADRCGITRTTLYIYFKNKRDIFNFSIKQFLSVLENAITEITKKKNISCTEKLTQVMNVIIKRLGENRRLLSAVLDYLVSKSDLDPGYRVRRRTVRTRHILTAMLIEGKKAGEFPSSMDVKDVNELLYSFLESAVFRLVVLRKSSVEELTDAMNLAVKLLAINPRD